MPHRLGIEDIGATPLCSLEVSQPYSASEWASDAEALVLKLLRQHSTVVMVGGMMYLQAFLYGMD